MTEAARQLGITRQALNNIVNGKSGISSEMAIRLASFFGLRAETVQQWQKDFELSQKRADRADRNRGTGYSFFLTSSELAAWADTIDARYTLPQLIRALVRVTGTAAIHADFPAREDAQGPGWDGVIESPLRMAYIPKGFSAWELSTESKPQIKAEKDLKKRTQNPLGLDPAKTTLVMVTLRKWPQRKQWATDKENESPWARVVVLDATDIEQWLELAPGVAVWLATRIGRRPQGVQSLDNFWSEFSASTTPPMTPALMLAGRTEAAERTAEWLKTGTGVLRILADSSDEALAFVGSIAANSTEMIVKNALTDVVVVSEIEQARQLMATRDPLTLAWKVTDPALLGTLTDRGHRAVVPVGRSMAGAEHSDIELSRSPRSEFVSAIQGSLRGPTDEQRNEEANIRAWECGRSITVYRRRYAAAGIASTPHWASPKEAGELVPLLLAGGWLESNNADKDVLSQLGGCEYIALSRLVSQWSTQSDSPFRRIGDAWTLVAPLDAWSLLARHITDTDLSRFRDALLAVLGEADPALDLEPDKRWLANVYNKQHSHSPALRHGLADSLILLGAIGDRTSLRPPGTLQGYCNDIVSKLINGKSDGTRWSSVSDLLPALAEAAPEPFLSALEDNLATAGPGVMKLFEVEERPLGGGARYTHLMWALEQLAWSPEYLSRAARILAKLAHLDATSKRANRLSASLGGIFCCWHPNTTASLEQRFQVLDALISRYPDVAWPLLLELLPTDHGIGHNGAEPRWRAKPERMTLTWADLFQAYDAVIERTLNMAGSECRRLGQVIGRIGNWRPEQRAQLVRQLAQFEETNTDQRERQALWLEIRDFIGHSRTYHFMDEADLAPIEAVFERLASQSALERHAWLFDDAMPSLTTPEATSTKEDVAVERRMEEAEVARKAGMKQIIDELGIDGIVALAGRAHLSGLVGAAAADCTGTNDRDFEILERLLSSPDLKVEHAGVSFVYRRRQISGGVEWAEAILRSERFKTWSPTMQASFCRGLPFDRATWAAANSLGQEVERGYWERELVFLLHLKEDRDAEYAVQKLLEVGRSLFALDQASHQPQRLSCKLLVRILDEALLEIAKLQKEIADGQKMDVGSLDHDVERILARLRDSGELSDNELGRLEWQYLPLLGHFRRPITLYRALQNGPGLFADVVAHAYRAEGAEDNAGSEAPPGDAAARSRARLAWELLSKWDLVPGFANGTLDAEQLRTWVTRARQECSSRGRSKIGDIHIGRMLAHAVPESDDVWPPVAVRNLIEDLESRDIESGLHSGRVSQRGVWTKSPADGGRPERELAKEYRATAKKLASQWQRTERLLNWLADTYEGLGRHDDNWAERMDLL